jgi:hypothetical protein
MFANVSNYEMKMPKRYVELSEEEMEYDGGFAWIPICAIISAVCTTVSVIATVAGNVGLIDKDIAKKVSTVATVVGVATGYASGIGTLWTSTAATTVRTLARATSSVSLEPGLSIATSQL